MRTIGIIILALILTCNIATAQDTLYIYKSGIVVSKRAVAQIDSVIFYKAGTFGNTVSYTVILASNPIAGGTTSGSGAFNSGASVTVNAVANTGYTFTNWSESGTAVSTTASYTFIISGNRTLVANYTTSTGDLKVTDADGNVYSTVTIGTQVWMVENLKTTKYRDGSPIPNITDNTQWGNLTTGAYCNYNNDAAIGAKYGKLYNWYSVNDSRNIAPVGWHVPTDVEWITLTNYVSANLGTSGSIAKALASKTDWASSTNGGAIGNDLTKNNTTGFTALPGGRRSGGGPFYYVGSYGYWWRSIGGSEGEAWDWSMSCSGSDVGRDYLGNEGGFSVRCVRD